MDSKPTYYSDYLQLKGLLACQVPKSKDSASESHDETLFIIVHQVYELWFKQILHELRSIQSYLARPTLEDRQLLGIISRLERIKAIQALFLPQLEIMESMTPMDFLEFRHLLLPASGFQSLQFREIEMIFGLTQTRRISIDKSGFIARLQEADQDHIRALEKTKSLFVLIEEWLERFPYSKTHDFCFWQAYQTSVDNMFAREKKRIEDDFLFSADEKKTQIRTIEDNQRTFASLLDVDQYERLLGEGKRSLSQKALLNALFICLYRDEPLLSQPYKVLRLIMDIDIDLITWRYRHALMAHRMLGTKIGTGGSSGYRYLKATADNNAVYTDLVDLATFFIPRSSLPELPDDLRRRLNFDKSDSD